MVRRFANIIFILSIFLVFGGFGFLLYKWPLITLSFIIVFLIVIIIYLYKAVRGSRWTP